MTAIAQNLALQFLNEKLRRLRLHFAVRVRADSELQKRQGAKQAVGRARVAAS